MNKNRWMRCMFVCGSLVTVSVHASAERIPSAPVIRAGGWEIYPGFTLAGKSNDNIFRQDSNKRSSTITVVSPSVAAFASSGGDDYSLEYVADLGRYANSAPDNYNDQRLKADAEWALTPRATLKLTPEFKVGHDERGSTYSTFTPSANVWHQSSIAGELGLGGEESIGRLMFAAHADGVNYQNNRTVTTLFDKNRGGLSGTFYFRTSPKVYAFLMLGEERISYKDALVSLDGKERVAMVGATWKATAQTSGSFKLGQLKKSFDSAMHTPYSGSSWEGNVRWSPRDSIRVDLDTERKTIETTGIGGYVLFTNHRLALEYELSEKTVLGMNVANTNERFSEAGRVDTTPSYGLRLDYGLREWLVMGVEYSHAAKTSTGYTGANPDFNNNIVTFNLHTRY